MLCLITVHIAPLSASGCTVLTFSDKAHRQQREVRRAQKQRLLQLQLYFFYNTLREQQQQ